MTRPPFVTEPWQMKPLFPQQLYDTKILVVDDDPFTCKLVRRVLDGLGFANHRDAPSAEAAIVQLESAPCDLLITDVQMQGMNGLELVRRIRGGLTAAPPDQRIIVLTSYSHTEVLRVAMSLEVNGFLVKPVKPSGVEAKIALAVSERGAVRSAPNYLAVQTEMRSVPVAPSPPGVLMPESSASAKPRRQLRIGDLRSGMLLEQDVLAADGTLLLSRGHQLSQQNINRLLELSQVILADSLLVSDGIG